MILRRLFGNDAVPRDAPERDRIQADETGLTAKLLSGGGIGVLFRRWEVVGAADLGACSYKAFDVMFDRLGWHTQQLAGCIAVGGEVPRELPDGPEYYVVAFLHADASQAACVREALASAHGDGLLPNKQRYLDGDALRAALGGRVSVAGLIDADGRLVLQAGSRHINSVWAAARWVAAT